MNKEQLNETILSKQNKNDTDKVLVFNTYKNISKKQLISILFKVSNIVNKKMFRYFKKYPDKRIIFYTFPQIAHNNTHAHVIAKIPEEYDRTEVLNLIEKTWKKFDDRQQTRFKLYNEDARTVTGNVLYSSRQFSNKDPDSFLMI